MHCDTTETLMLTSFQDRFGVEVTGLENAPEASVESLAKEVSRLLERQGRQGTADSSTHFGRSYAEWICRAPITIKMRLYCLPYAGGVSENVFGR